MPFQLPFSLAKHPPPLANIDDLIEQCYGAINDELKEQRAIQLQHKQFHRELQTIIAELPTLEPPRQNKSDEFEALQSQIGKLQQELQQLEQKKADQKKTPGQKIKMLKQLQSKAKQVAMRVGSLALPLYEQQIGLVLASQALQSAGLQQRAITQSLQNILAQNKLLRKELAQQKQKLKRQQRQEQAKCYFVPFWAPVKPAGLNLRQRWRQQSLSPQVLKVDARLKQIMRAVQAFKLS